MTPHQIPPSHPPRVDGDAAFEWLDDRDPPRPHGAIVVMAIGIAVTFGVAIGWAAVEVAAWVM